MVIAQNEAPRWGRAPRMALDSVPLLEIGSGTADSTLLYGVAGVHSLASGEIVIANAGTLQLLRFDSTGRLNAEAGRSGSGPGEFSGILSFFACGSDTLVVSEPGMLSFFDDELRFLRRVNVATRENGMFTEVLGVRSDCGGLVMVARRLPTPPFAIGSWEQAHEFFAAGPTGERLRPLGRAAGADLVVLNYKERTAPRMTPWGAEPVWSVANGRIYLGRSSSTEFTVITAEADTQLVVRWSSGGRRPVTADDRRAYQERCQRLAELDVRIADAWCPPLEVFAEIPVEKPAFSAIRVSDDRHVWVRQHPRISDGLPSIRGESGRDVEAEWWVFDPAGVWLGDVSTPGRLDVLSIRQGKVTGVWRDELDRESVRIYRIIDPTRK